MTTTTTTGKKSKQINVWLSSAEQLAPLTKEITVQTKGKRKE